MTTRQQLIESRLFIESTKGRDLIANVQEKDETPIRVVLSFDSFGDITAVTAHVFNELECVVAMNRKALGLPPHE